MADQDDVVSLIARLRAQCGLTQEELAEACGISARQIRQLERGAVARPRKHTLAALAEALGLDEFERDQFVRHYRSTSPEEPLTAFMPIRDRPFELPPRPVSFVGRGSELRRLDVALRCQPDPGPIILTGLAGIGKTGLAVVAAAAADDAFPDGQLFASLSTPAGAAYDPFDVLEAFLRSLGAPAESIPAELGARGAFLRTILATRRVLILLDNATSEKQVRPLLVSGASRVIVTSRSALGGLDTTLRLRVPNLDIESATELLVAALHREVTADERAILRGIAAACAGVPLALRLVAARAAMSGISDLSAFADRLGTSDHRLDGLISGDRSVRESILGSLRLLSPATRHTLSDLAHLNIRAFGDWQIAALADTSLAAAGCMTDEMFAIGVVEPHDVDSPRARYQLHDLVRASLRSSEPQGPQQAAFARLATYAIFLTAGAMTPAAARPVPHSLWPDRPSELSPDAVAAVVGDPRLWFEREWEGIAAIAEMAAVCRMPRLAGGVLAALRLGLTRTGRLDALIGLADRCSAAADGDALAKACSVLTSAAARAELGEHRLAAAMLAEVLDELEAADACTLAGAWQEVGWVHAELGDIARAMPAYTRAIGLHRSIANRYGELGCQLALAEIHSGRPKGSQQARVHTRSARDLARLIDDYRTESKVLLSLALVQTRIGDPGHGSRLARSAAKLASANQDEVLHMRAMIAVAAAERRRGQLVKALAAARTALEDGTLRNRPNDRADALTEVGHVERARGSTTAAQQCWREALRLREELLQHRQARELLALIAECESTPHLATQSTGVGPVPGAAAPPRAHPPQRPQKRTANARL